MPANTLRSDALVSKLINGSEGRPGYRQLAHDFQERTGRQPELVSMASSIGHDAIQAYRRSLAKGCGRAGVKLVCTDYLDENAMLQDVRATNNMGSPGGTMIKIPLRDRRREAELCEAVSDVRDVDGLSGRQTVKYRPVTPTAMRQLAEDHFGIEYLGDEKDLRIGVVGNGKSVGTPLIQDLQAMGHDPLVVTRSNADTTAHHLIECDLMFTATGAESVLPDHVKRGAVIIDAGVREVVEDGQVLTRGDVHPYIYEMDGVTVTPPIGGVGPLTATIMAGNTIDAAFRQMQPQDELLNI